MLSVILAGIKIIGIILAALLGLLLVLLLIIGFFPITYRGRSSYKDYFKSANTASYLFGICGMKFGYDKKPYAVLRIFWKRIDFFSEDEEAKESDEFDDFKDYSSDASKESLQEVKSLDGVNEEDIKNLDEENIERSNEENIERSNEENTADKNLESEIPDNKAVNIEEKKENAKNQNIENQFADNQKIDNENTDNEVEKNNRTRYKKKRHKLFIISHIKKRFKNAKERLIDNLKHIKEKKDSIISFLKNPGNQRLFGFLKKSIKKLLKHMLPRRTKGYIKYGFDDPYYTGKLLSYISLFSIAYNKDIKVIPAFDKQVIDFDFNYKGHMQLAVALYILLRVWFDKDFKRVYNEYKNR